jgi:hypothetical protein
MNDNDLERRLRAESGPREQGYLPSQLPASADSAQTSRGRSRMTRMAVLLPAAAAGVIVVAVAGALLTNNVPVGSGGSQTPSPSVPPSPSQAATVPSCTTADFAWSSDPWMGAAGSRGTTVLMRGVASLDSCRIDGSVDVVLRDNNGAAVVTTGAPSSHVTATAGSIFEMGVAWSNWCGDEPPQPIVLILTIPGTVDEVPLLPANGEVPVPPCNGPGQPTNLSATDIQPSSRTFPDG